MPTLIILPKQGQSVESCIIGTINKKKGDTVKKGDMLFSYETDKATFEEESPVDGTILELFYNEGDEVLVLENMMIIGEPDEDYSNLIQVHKEQGTTENKEQGTKSKDAETADSASKLQTQNSELKVSLGEFRRLSPRAKKLASKEAVEIAQITGAGPKGRIIEKDVQAALTNRPKLTACQKDRCNRRRSATKHRHRTSRHRQIV